MRGRRASISTPWLFTDELDGRASRAVSRITGVPQLRLHDVSFSSLYAYFLAPAWWLGATGRGYAAAKYLNAAVMTASIFPAYALARLFVPRPAAIACGVATAAIPSLASTRGADPGAARVLLGDARTVAPRARAAAPLGAPSPARGRARHRRPGDSLGARGADRRRAARRRASWRRRAHAGRQLIGSWSTRERVGAVVLALGGLIALGAFVNAPLVLLGDRHPLPPPRCSRTACGRPARS